MALFLGLIVLLLGTCYELGQMNPYMVVNELKEDLDKKYLEYLEYKLKRTSKSKKTVRE